MKYYIIAGEASGDLHGSNLMLSLLKQDAAAEIRFWGGDKMAAAGGSLVKHYKELAFMGFWEVFINLRTILGNISFCKKDILDFQPDVMVYIDYPGFNMRIAAWAKQQGFCNHYYISPQIWAWKENRIKKIKRDLDALYVILPFEKDYFREKHEYSVDYVGHPLVDVIRKERNQKEVNIPIELQTEQPIIALLPGSRKQEILKMMPVFLNVINAFPDYRFVLAGAPGLDAEWYKQFTNHPSIYMLQNQTYALLKHSFAAIVTSGTATLETALFRVPQLVCYKSSPISYAIAKRIIKLKYISLVNLIMDKEIVTELIQEKCTADSIQQELVRLSDPVLREKILQNYQEIEQKIGHINASEQVAQSIIAKLK
ncbi:lipid-A-disaccharide synthase [Flavobacteriaceae bacterium]|nr:lipid-A-disaccharide synthase [Flavobacteriaceae bacterium]